MSFYRIGHECLVVVGLLSATGCGSNGSDQSSSLGGSNSAGSAGVAAAKSTTSTLGSSAPSGGRGGVGSGGTSNTGNAVASGGRGGVGSGGTSNTGNAVASGGVPRSTGITSTQSGSSNAGRSQIVGTGGAPAGSGGTPSTSGGSSGTTSAAPRAGATATATGGTAAAGGSTASAGTRATSLGFVFSPYKDTTINLDWNTNVITTRVSGQPVALATDLKTAGADAVTLAFATGECGSENWGGVPGGSMAAANVPLFETAKVDFILSTGGAAGSFTCASDSGFSTFLSRWTSQHLLGVDFDIEAGQTETVITDLMRRIGVAHASHPTLRFSLTLATLANNDGATTARSLGSSVANSLNAHGDQALQAVKAVLGWTSPETFPSYLTINLMAMDYGSTSSGNCVVNNGECDMGQSAIQAVYNLHDHWGIPFANIEVTPMIGGNDTTSEHFTPTDVGTLTHFAVSQGLAGIHYWSYDRDVDCPPGSASPTCNTLGGVGIRGFLSRFLDALR